MGGPVEVEEIIVDTRERVRKVQQVMASEEKKWRAKYPILNNADAICMFFLITTLSIMGTMSYLYLEGTIPWYVASLVIGMCIGVHHEIEHDIIHNLYFKNKALIQDLLFSILFFTKFHVSPWQRRIYHWKHHRVSGQLNDVEERLVGMGVPLSAKRMYLAAHPSALYCQYGDVFADAPSFDFKSGTRDNTITTIGWQLVTKLYLLYVLQAYFNPADPYGKLPEFLWPIVKNLLVLLIIPATIRSTSLIVLTTNSHFYADIPKNSIFYQCQILQHWIFFPFTLFTCNFGATHIIHHYNALQPFYIRTLVTNATLDEMKRQGVRVNDWGVLLRANSFHRDPKNAKKEKIVFFLYIFALVAFFPLWVLLGDLNFWAHYIRDCFTGYTHKSKSQVEDDDYDNTLVKSD